MNRGVSCLLLLSTACSSAKYAQPPGLSMSGDRYDGRYAGRDEEPPKGDVATARPPEIDRPSVVYEGALTLRVKRVLEANERITKLTEEVNGYVESMTGSTAIVRVPAQGFDTVFARFAAIGEVLARSVRALDVTAQLTDLRARLEIAKVSRTRLLALFEKEKKVDERLKILASIKRLGEQIESLESTLFTLENRVDYYTITLTLVPIVENTPIAHLSPFPWIRGLNAHEATLFDGKSDIALAPPSGFVLFDQDEMYRAQSADTTILRAARTENDPHGDEAFWAEAVELELDGRDEELVDRGAAGKVVYRTFKNRDTDPRYYLIALKVAGEKLFVVEAFFPNETAYQNHKASIEKSLAALEVRS